MKNFSVLWFDWRLDSTPEKLIQSVKDICDIKIIRSHEDINIATKAPPSLIIFNFDFPDLSGLHCLQNTKRAFSSVPVLMLTEEHSENLAVWALRTRVWDYLVKPLAVEVLLERIRLLLPKQGIENHSRERVNFMPTPPIPMESRFRNNRCFTECSLIACAYIDNHLHEKISAETVAQLCGLSRCEFSRAFKREHGLTFRDYVIELRIRRAARMLSQTSSSITDIAFSLGFRDLSHFARLFRRVMGCVPREYGRYNPQFIATKDNSK